MLQSRGTTARNSFSSVISLLALAVALGGTAWAVSANSITSRAIKANAVKASEIATGAVASPEVANGSLTAADFANGQVLGGQGPAGPAGPTGPAGPPGADGTAITSGQALAKVMEADGAGSGLDADSIDGVESSELGRAYTFHETLTSAGAPIVWKPLVGGRELGLQCHPNATVVFLEPHTDAGSRVPSTVNLSATTSHAIPQEAPTALSIGLDNGTLRHGALLDPNGEYGVFLRDDQGGASSEIQLIFEQLGQVATVTLHIFHLAPTPSSSAFCEFTGSVLRGPTR